MGVPAGEVNDKVDFSEKYINWYLYHAITADDVKKGRVRASQVGEGFDMSKKEASDKSAAYNMGGEYIHYSDFFQAGFGPVDEMTEINGEYPYFYGGKNAKGNRVGISGSYDWTLPLNSEYRNAPSSAFLRNSRVLPSPASKDSDGKYSFNQDGVDSIKSELSQGRAIALAFYSSGNVWNYDNWTAYSFKDNTADHAVTVIGYDDTYSKDNFTLKNNSGTPIKRMTPPGDGAFIVKNSWGANPETESEKTFKHGDVTYQRAGSSSWGIDGSGYFYLSYYDRSLTSAMSFEFDSAASVRYAEHNIDQYDLMMTGFYGTADSADTIKTANIFEAEEDGYIYRISYRTAHPDTTVRYAVYRGVSGGDPESGAILDTGTLSHEYSGSYTVDLGGEYLIREGEKYSVVLTMDYTDGDGNKKYYEVFPYASSISGAAVNGIINKGESCLLTDGVWKDLSELKDRHTDRAFELLGEYVATEKTMTELDSKNKSSVAIDNFPIKAFLVPAALHEDGLVIGDVDGNGTINIDDATTVQKITAKLISPDERQKKAADVNADNKIDINDATMIQKYVAKLIDGFQITAGS